MKKIYLILACLIMLPSTGSAVEFAGIFVKDEITAENGQQLILNGVGLREKLWVDVYVGALYLPRKMSRVPDILANNSALRIQLDFVYKEVSIEKLLKAWRDGFGKNQEPDVREL